MDNIIKMKDINFQYNKEKLFENFNLSVRTGEWLSLIGTNGSGKSTLLKLITGIIRDGGFIEVDGLVLTDYSLMNIRKRIGVVFCNPDNTFVAETVMDELAFPLENLEYTKDSIKKRINYISEKLGLKDMLEKEPHRLSGGEKQLVALAVALVTKPKVLILDEALSMIDNKTRKKIIYFLKELNKIGMTIVDIANNLDNSIYSDRIIIINDGKKIIEGTRERVYKEEKILNRLGFSLPFMVDLSYKLMFYDLLDRPIYEIEEMVDILWE